MSTWPSRWKNQRKIWTISSRNRTRNVTFNYSVGITPLLTSIIDSELEVVRPFPGIDPIYASNLLVEIGFHEEIVNLGKRLTVFVSAQLGLGNQSVPVVVLARSWSFAVIHEVVWMAKGWDVESGTTTYTESHAEAS